MLCWLSPFESVRLKNIFAYTCDRAYNCFGTYAFSVLRHLVSFTFAPFSLLRFRCDIPMIIWIVLVTIEAFMRFVQFLCQVHVLHKTNYILKLLDDEAGRVLLSSLILPFSFGQFAIEYLCGLKLYRGNQWKLYVCTMYNNMKSKTSSNLTDIVLARTHSLRTFAQSHIHVFLLCSTVHAYREYKHEYDIRIGCESFKQFFFCSFFIQSHCADAFSVLAHYQWLYT